MQQQKPLEGAQLVIMTIALSLATFMQGLDILHQRADWRGGGVDDTANSART